MMPIKDGQLRKTRRFEKGFDESDVMAVIEMLNNRITEIENAIKYGNSISFDSMDYLKDMTLRESGLFKTGYNKADVLMVIDGLNLRIMELENQFKNIK